MADTSETTASVPSAGENATVGTPAVTPPAAGAAPEPSSSEGGAKPDARQPGEDKNSWLERVERARRSASAETEAKHKAWLKEKFGTDDIVEAEKRAARWAKLEADEEKRKREAMSEQDRLKADLDIERKKREAAEARVRDVEALRLHEQQSSNIGRIASSHIASEYAEDVTLIFAKHLRNRIANGEKAEVEAMTEKDVNRWFADFAKRKPAFAAATAAAPKTAPAAEPAKRQPVGAGAPPGNPPPKPNASGVVKTMRPGQPNSMTDQEVRATLRKQGFNY